MAGPSPLPLGQVPPSSQFQQLRGSNAPLNPSTSYGQGHPQFQQAPQVGPFIPNSSYQQPIVSAGNIPLATTPTGGSNPQSGWNQPGGIYAPGGAQNISNISFAGGFNPSQQSGYATLYTNQPGGYNQYTSQLGSNPQQEMYQLPNQFYTGMPQGGSGLYGTQYPYPQNTQNSFAPTKLPFLGTPELLDLSKLMNNPIQHHPAWPLVPVKIPTDIPKFDGKTGQDPTNHIATYHLWCVSNSFLDDSIKLRLFPRTLTGNAAKWFIELPSVAFFDFQSLAIAFLTHFQLPIHYEMGTELLTSLWQNIATHISDHIHEWRRRQRLVKGPIPDALLADWFTKSLLPKISCGVAMSGAVTEEDVIRHAQHLDLIYSQSDTLYDIIPNAP